MTLRSAIGDENARRIHALVDELLDGEDGLIVLIDQRRAITYGAGFGLSPCQQELATNEIERTVRAFGGTTRITRRRSLAGAAECMRRARQHGASGRAGPT